MNVLNAQIIISAADRASKVFGAVAKNAGGLEATLGRIGSRMMKTGAVMTATVTAPVVAFAAKSIGAAQVFEGQLVELRKEMDQLSPEAFDNISKSLRAIPRSLPVDLAAVMATATSAAEAGIDPARIERFTRLAANMSLAIGEPIQKVGDSLGVIGKSYGLQTEGLERVADAVQFYADALNSSEASVLSFVQSVGPLARSLKLTAEQAASYGAALMSQGMGAEEAAAGFETLLKKLADGKNMKAAAKVAGMTAKQFRKSWDADANGTLLKVIANIGKLGTAQEQQAALASIVGAKQAAGLLPLVRAYADVMAAQEQAAAGAADGIVSRKTAEQVKTYAAQVQRLSNAWGDLQITVGSKILPVITPQLERLNALVEEWTAGPEGEKRVDWAVKLGLTAAAVGPLLIGAGMVVRALGSIATAIRAVYSAAALLGGAGLLAAGAVGLLALSVGNAADAAWPEMIEDLRNAAGNASIAADQVMRFKKALVELDGPEMTASGSSFFGSLAKAVDSIAVAATEIEAEWARFFGIESGADHFEKQADAMRKVIRQRYIDAAVNAEVKPPPGTNAPGQGGPAYSPVTLPWLDLHMKLQEWLNRPAPAMPQLKVYEPSAVKGDLQMPGVSPEQIKAILSNSEIKFLPGSLDTALAGKVEAEVIKPVTAELKGDAVVNVRVQVEGPGRVVSATATSSGHIRPRVGVDNTAAPAYGGPR